MAGPGWKFIVPPGPYTARNPRFRGADMTNDGQTVAVTPQNQPILEFRGNEVYGLAADGFTAWNIGTDGYDIKPASMGETLLKDFRVWHTYEAAVWMYPVNRVTIDGLVYRVDPAATTYWRAAVVSGDYRDIDLTIRGGSIHAGLIAGEISTPWERCASRTLTPWFVNMRSSFALPQLRGPEPAGQPRASPSS